MEALPGRWHGTRPPQCPPQPSDRAAVPAAHVSREAIPPAGSSAPEQTFQRFTELGAKLAAFSLRSCSTTVQVFTTCCLGPWPGGASEGHRGASLDA